MSAASRSRRTSRAFLDLDLPGSKVVVGDGPAMTELKSRHPDAHFLGEHTGAELARLYASSDVFVFPSRTDTFGIVLLEALASGLPVAAYPVTGPIDVVGEAGVLSEDLGEAARAALTIDREKARQMALGYSWRACAEMFLGHIRDVYAGSRGGALMGPQTGDAAPVAPPSAAGHLPLKGGDWLTALVAPFIKVGRVRPARCSAKGHWHHLTSDSEPYHTSRLCSIAASMKLAKSGCGSNGRLFNSGWYWTPMNQGWSGYSTVSAARRRATCRQTPGRNPPAAPCSRC